MKVTLKLYLRKNCRSILLIVKDKNWFLFIIDVLLFCARDLHVDILEGHKKSKFLKKNKVFIASHLDWILFLWTFDDVIIWNGFIRNYFIKK